MLFFYIRHGDPIYDPDSLTPLGRRQAESVAKRLALYGIDKIYASTSTRAIETARPTCELLKKEMTLLDFANESHAWRDLAVLQEDGKKKWACETERFRRLFVSREVRSLQTRWYDHPAFAGFPSFREGIERIDRELDAFFLSLGYEHKREEGYFLPVHPTNERIALFAHAGFGGAMLASLLDIPYPYVCSQFDMSHSSLTVISFFETDGVVIPQVLTFSNDSHLYRDGLPTRHNNRLYF